MSRRRTVVWREARRRWALVLTALAVLVATPAIVRGWPIADPGVDVGALRERIARSTRQPHWGHAQSSGALGLPALPRLGQLPRLLSGTTQMRTWYAGRDRWRVDVVGIGTERGHYRTSQGQFLWEYGADQLINVVGDPPVRLPRAADLLPPDLGRRLINAAEGDLVGAAPARRVAGITAAGLRIIPADPRSTVRRVDLWAEPRTGLPLQVEILGRGEARPVLVSRFVDVTLAAPESTVLTPPAPRPGLRSTRTENLDVLTTLNQYAGWAELPDRLAGRERRDHIPGVSVAARYGTGLAQFAVLTMPGRIGEEVYDNAVAFGRRIAYRNGQATLITTSVLSVLVIDAARTWIVVGPVDPQLLRQVGADLTGAPT